MGKPRREGLARRPDGSRSDSHGERRAAGHPSSIASVAGRDPATPEASTGPRRPRACLRRPHARQVVGYRQWRPPDGSGKAQAWSMLHLRSSTASAPEAGTVRVVCSRREDLRGCSACTRPDRPLRRDNSRDACGSRRGGRSRRGSAAIRFRWRCMMLSLNVSARPSGIPRARPIPCEVRRPLHTFANIPGRSIVSRIPERPNTYQPSAKDWQYLAAVKRTLEEPGCSPRARLMALAGFKTRAGLLQFEQSRARMAWVSHELGRGHEPSWEMLLSSAWEKAIAGDIRWAEFYGVATGHIPPQRRMWKTR